MKLTIGMANWDDPEGAWWTLSSIRMNHVYGQDQSIELLVVDDMPEPQAKLQHVCALANARYVHSGRGQGPARAKDAVWEHAKGDYVLLVDSHVLLATNTIQYLMHGIDMNAVGKDLWCGPLINESGGMVATELLPELRGHFFGVWHVNTSPDPVREIIAHGSAYSFMKRSEYPGFSKHFRGFAGEEVYLHDKVRRNGGKVLFHRALGWCHRFDRFGRQITYALTLNDKMRNYLIAGYECDWNVPQLREYFGKGLPLEQRLNVENDVLAIYPDIFTRDYSHTPTIKAHD